MDEMRRAFETWARAGAMDLHKGEFYGYLYPATGIAWSAWQEACEWHRIHTCRMGVDL
jgi:hypothetical protein